MVYRNGLSLVKFYKLKGAFMKLVKNYTYGIKRGQNHGRAKLSDHEVELLRKMVSSAELTQKEAAAFFGISKAYVSELMSYLYR